MSQSLRQSELFAGADWQVLYRAFTTINFNASDPPTINAALRSYIQQNYPENMNDWTESSEFVALIDLLSWLAGTLAFKTDINAREAFLETAETRAAILRLARFISYNPRRNQAAQGLVKLVEVSTDDDIYDGFGVNLNGVAIKWDNPDDSDWFERFTLVLNASFISTNLFGTPLKTGTVADAKTQLYRFNNRMGGFAPGFSAKASGTTMDFEVVNVDFDDGGGFYERDPNDENAFHLTYRNDGNGNSSSQTGFFMLFKQGTTQRQTYGISTPVENRVIDLNTNGINDTDVWVQTVTDSGTVTANWAKVPAIYNENITYNNYDASIRNIFSVITRDEDAISLRFSDGRFGAVPVGNIRSTYRVSNGLQYQIKPSDINRVKLTLPYTNRRGVPKNLTLTFSLQESVSNSTPRETDDQIKARAPSVYATQNRMVSGEDYNTFPLQSNLAVKLKAVNRVYSGHSRFIDLNDPTGTYQDLNVFSDDGIFFREPYNLYTEVPLALNASASELITNYIQPMLQRQEVSDQSRFLLLNKGSAPNLATTWVRASSDNSFSSTGSFTNGNPSTPDPRMIPGATLLMSSGGKQFWATIASVTGTTTDAYEPSSAGSAGPVALSINAPDGAQIVEIVPPWNASLDSAATVAITAKITSNRSFTIWYDYTTTGSPWVITDASALTAVPTDTGTRTKIMAVDYAPGSVWTIQAAGMRYVFESLKQVQWYNDGRKAQDSETGLAKHDLVRIKKVNEDLTNDLGRGLGRDYDLNIDRIYLNRDGSANPRRTTVTLADNNLNGYQDDPDLFSRVADADTRNTYLFWASDTNYGSTPISNVTVFEAETTRIAANTTLAPVGTLAFQLTSNTVARNNSFWMQTSTGWLMQRPSTYTYGIGRGANIASRWINANAVVTTPGTGDWTTPSTLDFQWKHYADTDHRIDPSPTNTHDMFVLTSEYDYLTRLWIKSGADPSQIPAPPTELDLRLAFEQFEDYRMFSDGMVWRPARYKFLFGNGAADELRSQFKVVKLPNSTLSDGEIASQLIRAVNDYFDASLWDFGETFYFTELTAYIHQRLANVISSCVLVPLNASSNFGDGFEVRSRSDELFISTAQVADVVIISSNTSSNLRIR
jgi:hypothetical protein